MKCSIPIKLRGLRNLLFVCPLLLLMSVLHVLGQAQTEQEARFEQLARAAFEAQRAGNTEDAIRAYKQALELRPDWGEGMFYVATLYFGTQHYAEAIPYLRNLTKQRPDEGVVWALLGLAEYRTQSYESALANLRHAHEVGLRAAPDALAQAYVAFGELLNRNGEFPLAQRVLQPASEKGGMQEAARFALGINLLQIRALPSEVQSGDVPTIKAAGEIAVALNSSHYNEAFRQLDALLAQRPDDPRLRGVYGWALANVSRFDEAERQFREQIRLAPNSPSPWIGLSEISLKRQRWPQAREAAEQALRIYPDSSAAHEYLGRALLELGRVQEAAGQLETAVKLSPENPETHFALARAYAKAKRPEDARREREKFLQLGGNAQP